MKTLYNQSTQLINTYIKKTTCYSLYVSLSVALSLLHDGYWLDAIHKEITS